jgi:hypothetical protein
VRSTALLDQLPKEILETIFEFLAARSISACVGVSKYWNHVICAKSITQKIYDAELASLKTTKSTLERIIGREVNDNWLVDSKFTANYPKRWMIQDYERWKIFEFSPAINLFQFRQYFRADPTLAIRLRGKYCGQTSRFRMGPDGLTNRIQICKDPAGALDWPYFSCHYILEDGKEYEFITTLSYIVYDPQAPVKAIHRLRPLDGPNTRTYNRLPPTRQLILTLCGMLVAMFLLDLIFNAFIHVGQRYLMRITFGERSNGILCLRNIGADYFGPLTLAVCMVMHEPKTLFKFFGDRDIRVTQQIKVALWLIGNYIGFTWFLNYFVTFGWWFQSATFAPHEAAMLYVFIGDIRKRNKTARYGNVFLVTVLAPILVGLMMTAFTQRNNFSVLAYMVHVIFVLFTFAYSRLVFVNAFRLMSPWTFASSKSMKKWINWSLPVKSWFVYMLVVMPMFTLVCSCLGPYLFG